MKIVLRDTELALSHLLLASHPLPQAGAWPILTLLFALPVALENPFIPSRASSGKQPSRDSPAACASRGSLSGDLRPLPHHRLFFYQSPLASSQSAPLGFFAALRAQVLGHLAKEHSF